MTGYWRVSPVPGVRHPEFARLSMPAEEGWAGFRHPARPRWGPPTECDL